MTNVALKAPGLYVRPLETELPSVARTALTAFVGVAERGPLDEPQLLASYGDFETVFGGAWGFGALAPSLYAFFLNGGEEACVVRVARPAIAVPAAPAVDAENVGFARAGAAILDVNGLETFRLSARNPGSWGNQLRAVILTDAQRPMSLARLSAASSSGGLELKVTAVWDFRMGGRIVVTHAHNAFRRSTHEVDAIDAGQHRLTVSPALPHDYPIDSEVSGFGFRLAVSDGKRHEVFEGLSVDPSHPRHFVDVINGPSGRSYLALAQDGHSLLVTAEQIVGNDGLPRFKPAALSELKFFGGGDGTTNATGTLASAALSPLIAITARQKGRAGAGVRISAEPFTGRLALAVPEAPGGAKDRLVVEDVRGWTVGDSVAVRHAQNPATAETASITAVDPDTHALTLNSSLANHYPLGSVCFVADRFNLSVEPAGPQRRESFFNLSSRAGARFVEDVVDGVAGTGAQRSTLIRVTVAPVPAPAPAPAPIPVGSVVLGGGSDPDEVPLSNYAGYQADGTLFLPNAASSPLGLASLESVPEVSLIALPDISVRQDLDLDERAVVASLLLLHCQKMGERFALLDVPRELELPQVRDWPARFSSGAAARFGALYFPWLVLPIQGIDYLLPPSAAVAGLMARSDRQDGVGKAPANLQLQGATKAEPNLDAAEQGELNLVGVNCVRKFDGGTLRLWGARTLSRETAHLYVHNRRVVLLTVKMLTSGLRWAVFEPNDRHLRRRIKDSLDGSLQGMLARGLTAGRRPEEAFYVRIDGLESDSAGVDSGLLLAEIGIAVSKPAEFVVISVKRSPEMLTLVEEEA